MKELTSDVDVVIGLHRVVRQPAEGRIEIFRFVRDLEIGLFIPPERWSEKPSWRVIIQDDSVPDLYVDLTDHDEGHTVRIVPRMNPPAPDIGKKEPWRSSAISRANIEIYDRGFKRDQARVPQGDFTYVVHWADETKFDGLFRPSWRSARYEGNVFRTPVTDFRCELKSRIREASGLAPTPARFLRDGLQSAESARTEYLKKVRASPAARQRAIHILGRCEF
jgi:hypothetical protein